jgi:hypothetical protein
MNEDLGGRWNAGRGNEPDSYDVPFDAPTRFSPAAWSGASIGRNEFENSTKSGNHTAADFGQEHLRSGASMNMQMTHQPEMSARLLSEVQTHRSRSHTPPNGSTRVRSPTVSLHSMRTEMGASSVSDESSGIRNSSPMNPNARLSSSTRVPATDTELGWDQDFNLEPTPLPPVYSWQGGQLRQVDEVVSVANHPDFVQIDSHTFAFVNGHSKTSAVHWPIQT